MGFLTKIFGTAHDRNMKVIRPYVDRINQLEKSMEKLSDSELKAKTSEFKSRIEKGEDLDNLITEAFATCREAAKRVLKMRHYDVQLVGGYVLHTRSLC